MEYKNIKDLEQFLVEIENYLLTEENHFVVNYPPENIANWDSEKLLEANNNILSKLSGKANVYVIFTATKNSDAYILRYIGKTKKKLARERIKNHLIKKHEKIGAKLSEIIAHVQTGGKVKISWVTVEPESLRNYIEEELINKYKQADWNRENNKSVSRKDR